MFVVWAAFSGTGAGCKGLLMLLLLLSAFDNFYSLKNDFSEN